MSNEKKLIIITGASSGIGQATAIEFSKAGHPVLLLARRVERCEALNLPNSMSEKVDITDYEAFKAAIEKAVTKFGDVDCLINCAGMMLLGAVDSQEPKEWKKMFDLNVNALLDGMHFVLPKMIANKCGTIINISSIAGRKTFPNHAAYCGTKFAVHAISENVREEVAAHGVRVIVIAPGVVETELLGHTTSDDIKSGYQDWKKTVGKVLEPTDVARSIKFAYDQPEYVCIREIVLAATRQEP